MGLLHLKFFSRFIYLGNKQESEGRVDKEVDGGCEYGDL